MNPVAVFLLAAALFASTPLAQAADSASVSVGEAIAPAHPVLLDGDTLFTLRAGSGTFSPQERATVVSARLEELAARPDFTADSLRLQSFEGAREVVYADQLLFRVTREDAAGGDVDSLAGVLRGIVLAALDGTTAEANLWRILTRAAGAVGIILLIVLVELLVFRLARRIKQWIADVAARGRLPELRIQRVTLLTPQRSQEILLGLFRTMVTTVHIVIAYAAVLLLFSVFPWTRDWAGTLFTWSLRPFRAAFSGFVDFIPDLFHIVIVLVLAHLFLRVLRRLALEVEAGNLRLPGFYADWGRPTLNIVRFVTYAFALVLIFPKLPGSDSAAFRGVSVFLGVLISLGSSSAFSNIIAGIVMTYMRSFRMGDRIQVGEVIGDVVEKTLLVTRLKTFHGETVTLPNSALLAGNTVNYTVAASGQGLLLHTQVTIGYDAPWRTVHTLLVGAASKTEGVVAEPAPFVLQKALNDFYVTYELNAYTREPARMNFIYSSLHQNIQDAFFAAGVEIMSPHYRSMRDGSTAAIPPEFRPARFKNGKTEQEGKMGEGTPR